MDKKEKILETALKLFVEFGFHGTPTSKIASDAGISNGTLFHYFKTKNELIITLYTEIKDELNHFLYSKIEQETNIEAIIKQIFIESILWALQNSDKFYYIQQIHFSPHYAEIPKEIIEKNIRLHIELIEKAIAEKIIKPFPTALLYINVNSQIVGLFQYLKSVNFSAEQQKDLIENSFFLLWETIKEK